MNNVMFSLCMYSRIYFGPRPFLFITDLDMIKDITVKLFDKFVDRAVSEYTLSVLPMYSEISIKHVFNLESF